MYKIMFKIKDQKTELFFRTRAASIQQLELCIDAGYECSIGYHHEFSAAKCDGVKEIPDSKHTVEFESLKDMVKLYDKMMTVINHKQTCYDSECIGMMNDTLINARRVIRELEKGNNNV